MTALRVVTDTDGDPLDRGEAHEAITRCWQAARSAYVAAIGVVGEVPLRQLAESGDGGYRRWHVARMRDRARALAECATRMADDLDRAVDAFDRYEGGAR